MGASKPATYGHFKTSHQFQGFAFPFSLYPPSFPVQSIRNRLGFLFPPEARASRRHNIPADDRSPGCESHPDRLKPPPRQGPPSRGALWLVLNPRARLRAIRSTLETTTVLTVPAKMEVCKEPDHVGLGHLAHGVAGQPLQGEQPGGQLVRRQPIARPAAQLLQRERLPGASTTAAPIRSPHSGSGRPTTATSRTAGCSPIASSTSRAETFTRWRTRVPLRQTGLLREHGFHFAPEVGCGNYCCSPATACLSPTTSYHP